MLQATDGTHHQANYNDLLGPSEAPEEVIENDASLTHQNEPLPTPVPESTQRHSVSTPASCSTSARGSSLAVQGGGPLIEAAAALVCMPGVKSRQRNQKDKDAQKFLKWNRKSGGTRDLVEKTREAFLLQMAVDTRKAGLPLSFAALVLSISQKPSVN